MKIIPRGLYGKLVLYVSLVVISVISILGVVSYRHYLFHWESSSRENVMLMARNLSLTCADYLIVRDYAGMEVYLKRFVELQNVLKIQVYDKDGNILSDIVHERGSLPQARYGLEPLQLSGSLQPAAVTENGKTVVLYPITAGNTLGWVRLHYSLKEMQDMKSDVLLDTILMSVFATFLTFLALLIVLRRPALLIRRIADFAKRLDEIKGETIPVRQEFVEIEELCESLNHASKELCAHEQALISHRDKLEEEVAGRTIELSNANELLQQELAERKKAEEELKKSGQLYKELTETLGEALSEVKKREQILQKGRDAFLNMLEDVSESYRELVIAYDKTIEGWSKALDYRDKETEGHSRRVTEMTVDMARSMDMDENEIVHVRRGALLHDIGKLGVPDSILFKPGRLSEEEWEIMRRHPVIAYDLLLPIPFLRPALDIPYCHHEKWDGTGYPRGLKGEEIPLSARIFAIVDVWDALRSDRPYRPAWSEEAVREHLRSLSGTHFDPKVVEAFLRALESGDGT